MILRPAPIFTDISNILCQRPFGTKCPEGARRVEGGNMDKNQGYTILRAAMLENGRGFALRGGRSTRSQTGLAPGASAAHRRWIADKKRPERKGAVARQASNPLEAAEKRGVPGGLQRGPRRGGAPNRPPLPPREAATLRGRESARRRSREPSPTHYIIILNH